jgi:hypothetical protein
VIESLKKNELLSTVTYADTDAKLTRGEIMADKLAAFEMAVSPLRWTASPKRPASRAGFTNRESGSRF